MITEDNFKDILEYLGFNENWKSGNFEVDFDNLFANRDFVRLAVFFLIVFSFAALSRDL